MMENASISRHALHLVKRVKNGKSTRNMISLLLQHSAIEKNDNLVQHSSIKKWLKWYFKKLKQRWIQGWIKPKLGLSRNFPGLESAWLESGLSKKRLGLAFHESCILFRGVDKKIVWVSSNKIQLYRKQTIQTESYWTKTR